MPSCEVLTNETLAEAGACIPFLEGQGEAEAEAEGGGKGEGEV